MQSNQEVSSTKSGKRNFTRIKGRFRLIDLQNEAYAEDRSLIQSYLNNPRFAFSKNQESLRPYFVCLLQILLTK